MEEETKIQFMLGELTQGVKSLDGKIDLYMAETNKRLDKHDDEISDLGKSDALFSAKMAKISTKVGSITGLIGIVTGSIGSFLMEFILKK